MDPRLELVVPITAHRTVGDADEDDRSTRTIIGASPRSRKKVVLGALKTMVHGFNALQKQHKCLETWERDDLCSLMGDMLHVSKVTADPALLFEQWEDM